MKYTDETIKIAKFMGLKEITGLYDDILDTTFYSYQPDNRYGLESVPHYNTWNDIMPVVIKIESMGGDENEFDIFGNCVQLGDEEFVGKTKMEAVRKAIDWWLKENQST
jgi:hypothetical protein